ncbi:hypothetical protein KAX35_04595 [candidate division WOR-3 bacterium]|nr:hypothetical protein [candidate division WOR-3 bacterium]
MYKSRTTLIIVLLYPLLHTISLFGATWTQSVWAIPENVFFEDTTFYLISKNINSIHDYSCLTLSISTTLQVLQMGQNINIRDFERVQDTLIYLCTGDDSVCVYKSSDEGDSWQRVFSYDGWQSAYSMLWDNDTYLYLGIEHTTLPDGYLKRSGDMGYTWPGSSAMVGVEKIHSILRMNDLIYAGGGDSVAIVYTGSMDNWMENYFDDNAILALYSFSDTLILACTGYENGLVYKSNDNGNTWIECSDLPGAKSVFCLSIGGDSAVYAGTDTSGIVYKTIDTGDTWAECGDLPFAEKVRSLIFIPENSVLIAGCECVDDTARAYISMDNGTSWIPFGTLPGALSTYCLLYTYHSSLLAGTDFDGAIFRMVGFDSTGWLISSLYNTRVDNGSTQFGIMSWNAEENEQQIILRVRTFPPGIDSVTLDSLARDTLWLECDTIVNGQDISDIGSVNDGDQFIQYRIDLLTDDPYHTPIFEEIGIEYFSDTIGAHLTGAIAYGGEIFEGDSVAPNDRIVISFDEPTNLFIPDANNIDSILKLSSDHTWLDSMGYLGTINWTLDSVIMTIYLGGAIWNNMVAPGDTIFLQPIGIGDKWLNYDTSSCIITGTFAPFIDSIVAYEYIDSIEGIDNDDYVMLYFSKRTNMPDIGDSLIDSILAVKSGDSNKTWLSGDRNIRAIHWDSIGFTLTCSLCVDGGKPTISTGDSVFPDGETIRDKFNKYPVLSPCVITGDFGDYGPVIDSVLAFFDSIPLQPYDDDWVILFFNEETNVPDLDALNIDDVLSLSGGNSWNIDSSYFVNTCWSLDSTILLVNWWEIGIEDTVSRQLPITSYLYQNFPNPFLFNTVIIYAIGCKQYKVRRSEGLGIPSSNLTLHSSLLSSPVAVGDTIYPDSITIQDLKGHPCVKPAVIRSAYGKKASSVRREFNFMEYGDDALNCDILLTTHYSPFIPLNKFTIPSGLTTSIFIYDLAGRLVRRLVDSPHSPGIYRVEWDGKGDEGNNVRSGIYFYCLEIDGRIIRKVKMVKVR